MDLSDNLEFPAGQTIERDFACSACQYNLRGLKPEGSCPECGQPIARSIEVARLLYAGRFQIGRPLRQIFWGALLCLLDFKIGGADFSCDLLNDTVGMILIAVGVTTLSRLPVDERYRKAMTFLKIVAYVGIVTSLRSFYAGRMDPIVQVPFTLLQFLSLAAIIVFCLALRWYCEAAGLPAAVKTWRTSLVLFSVLMVVPSAAFAIIGLVASVSGHSGKINLGAEGLLLLPVLVLFLVPPIHLLVSMRRTIREAEAVAGTRLTPSAFRTNSAV